MIFITGRGRSGTTLLSRLLNAHPKISVAKEGMFVLNLESRYRSIKNWSKKELESFYSDLWLEDRLEKWNINKEELKTDILASKPNSTFSDLCKLVYHHSALGNSKLDVHETLLIDKNPHYSLFTERLIRLFPNAKFIFITRDYRDNILSYKNVRFDLNNTGALAYRWVYFNKRILKFANKFPEKILLIKFENLVSTTSLVLQDICSFLEIEFDNRMLEFYKNENEAVSWHKNLLNPPDMTSINKWQNVMSQADLKMAMYVCSGFARQLHYETPEFDINYRLKAKAIFGVLYGWLILNAEKFLFKVPQKIRSKVIFKYRKVTGSVDAKK